jgi:hypothetical protein
MEDVRVAVGRAVLAQRTDRTRALPRRFAADSKLAMKNAIEAGLTQM